MNKFQRKIQQFSRARDWDQFHNPKDLLLGIVEEIGEIRNIVKWEQDPAKMLSEAILKFYQNLLVRQFESGGYVVVIHNDLQTSIKN